MYSQNTSEVFNKAQLLLLSQLLLPLRLIIQLTFRICTCLFFWLSTLVREFGLGEATFPMRLIPLFTSGITTHQKPSSLVSGTREHYTLTLSYPTLISIPLTLNLAQIPEVRCQVWRWSGVTLTSLQENPTQANSLAVILGSYSEPSILQGSSMVYKLSVGHRFSPLSLSVMIQLIRGFKLFLHQSSKSWTLYRLPVGGLCGAGAAMLCSHGNKMFCRLSIMSAGTSVWASLNGDGKFGCGLKFYIHIRPEPGASDSIHPGVIH